ncbi:serine/threonine-protein kinase [Pseudonocardia asaccharolytica]|uniref:non-specific serine/threonine protein kinase n=1 Tax=Pseudonocardia asaccharolytica DSM 44247 = NBRC 16224 TaxID=1123024 RepID=A0A511D0S1_9PSEU|nr:serine/threonine-protein kinase [Pseudonocardia asaccharolytica]GEL18366.1 protein kinase [Pseudonocardia asaccharolytica DSM 44247 = NBRC 16224]
MARRRILNGRYELDELPVGKGGMGEVWLGRDIRLEREVAVKLIRFPDDVADEELVRRFVRESRITARLEHPGVPAVYDVGTQAGRPFMVMQRIRGISVSDLIAEHGPLPIGWAAAIAAQTCSVLSAAHRESLIHRDLKPGNLMLCSDGTVRVLDFGLAVALASSDSQITRTGQTLGTPAYMAPELVLAGMTGPQTDLYAVGCTLHEMLTGRCPFRGATAYAVMTKQVDERPPAVRSVRGEVPPGLETLVLELLAKAPEERPGSADAVYRRLLPFVGELGMLPGVLTPPSVPSPVRMYASVVGRALSVSEPAAPPREAAAAQPHAPQRFSRGELERARAEADSLVRESRYSQAAEVLAAVAQPATRMLGAADPDVLSLRFQLAIIRFDGGDYRRAAPTFADLAADIAAHVGPDEELALRCRRQEATCNALIGQTSKALRQLGELLEVERGRYGADDERVLELRKQIGLLQLGSGRQEAAQQTLRGLLADVERVKGPHDAAVEAIRKLIPPSTMDS